MPEDLMSRSEVAKFLGISKKKVDSYLEPVRDSEGKPYRIGREYAYLRGEVKEKKKDVERERRRIRKITLGPEDLSSEQKNELGRSAVTYEGNKAIGKAIEASANNERENMENILGRKEQYTGDDITKSISYGWDIKSTVKVEQVLKYFSRRFLENQSILEKNYNAKLLEKKGPELMKVKLNNVVGKFESFYEERNIKLEELDQKGFEKTVRDFSRKHRTSIPMRYLMGMMIDYKNNRLTDRKLGEYSRKLIETCVVKTPKTRKLRITLHDKHKKSIEKIAEEIADETEFPKLKELQNKLFNE
jgi:hypothetical protein